MSHMYPNIPATCILTGQIIDHTKDPMETAHMKHHKNHMKTVIEPFKTRDTVNQGRRLTKDKTNRDIR